MENPKKTVKTFSFTFQDFDTVRPEITIFPNDLVNNKDYLVQIMKDGAEKAERIANRTLGKVYRKIGLVSK